MQVNANRSHARIDRLAVVPASHGGIDTRRSGLMKRDMLRLLAGATALGSLPEVRADDYPSRPTRLIVGFPPGQGSDSIARAVAQRMQAQMGQPWYVENRAGASGMLAQQA